MDQAVSTFLIKLNQLNHSQHSAELLTAAASLLQEQFAAETVVGFTLIPETGGVPTREPIISGRCSASGHETLQTLTHTDMLSDFIRHWQPHFENNVAKWLELDQKNAQPSAYARFLELEEIKTFVFLPLGEGNTKLGILLLNYRHSRSFDEHEQEALNACANLMSTYLGRLMRQLLSQPTLKKRMAVAHTLYGSAAVSFKGHIDSLEHELHQTVNGDMMPNLLPHLEAARNMVFEVMRTLVIEASGELLVNLKQMSLAKALNTTAAALKRAWPQSRQVIIDIPPISAQIERQPIHLKQILYTLTLEAIGNAIKHGGPAPYIHVDISWSNYQIYIKVIDHGRGFDPQAATFSEHGLGFWHQYITEQLQGVFRVVSQPSGFGTVVEAQIPVIPTRSEHVTKWV